MRFKAVIDDYTAIITDDYDKEEIAKQKHLKNLVKDLIKFDITTPVYVYDNDNHFIRIITQDMFTPLELL